MSEPGLDSPALQPPSGVQPDFDNPPNANAAVNVMLALCLALTSIFLLLRIYTRIICTRQFQLLDLMAIVAFPTYIVYIWTSYRQIAGIGFFVQQWNTRIGDVILYLFYGFVGISMYSFTIMLIKAAILLEWVRIFVPAGTRNSFYYTCHILLWINVLFYVAIIIAVNLACTPYEQNWNFLLDGHCIRTDRANMASAIINFVFDLIIPILPQRGIWKLHMSRQKKLGVSLVFAIGLMFVSLWASSLNVEYMSINILIPLLFSACLTAGIRVGITIRAVTTTPYTTYSYSQLSLCCLAEMTCGFLVFCIPSAPRAFHTLKDTKMISTLKSWTRSSVEGMKGTRTNGSSMPRSSLKPSIYNRAHEVDERGLIALETLGTGDLIQQQLYTSEQSPSRPEIAPATHFMATEDLSSGSPSEAYLYSQQRPWGQDEGPWEQRR